MTDTLEPLDVSPWAPESSDSPEVAALKATVKKVAKKYQKRHGWCDEVKRALREMGIDDERDILVRVETSLGLTSNLRMAPSSLLGKAAEEQRKVLAKAAGPIALGESSKPMPPDLITGWRVLSPLPGTPPNIWRKSSDGKVNHLWLGLGDPLFDRRWINAACGQTEFPGRVSDPDSIAERSCTKCSRTAAARETPPPGAVAPAQKKELPTLKV